MTDDDKALLARLLDFNDNWHEASCKEAADRIEAQAAEIERLRGLLAEAVEYPASDYLDNGVLNRIYAALEGKAEQ
jgi:hypothetical protein